MFPPPPGVWSPAELKRDAARAQALFVRSRLAALQDEKATYVAAHATAAAKVEKMLMATRDLSTITGTALQDRAVIDIARYLAIPPISLDDLDTLTDSCFKSWVSQKTDRGRRPTTREFNAAAALISQRIDERRAPWIAAGRAPTARERAVFVHGAASVPATGAVLTARRGQAAAQQEADIRAAAAAAGYGEATTSGTLRDPIDEMPPGTYAPKARKLNATSMDVAIRLRRNHPTGLEFLAVEAKVSNSSLNSRKRLLEVTRKRDVWDRSGALYAFRTAAVLAGVFSVERLLEAQEAGVLIFWQHRLTDLTTYLR